MRLILVVLTILLTVPVKADRPVGVSMVQLIANPKKFDGKFVRVIGFLRLEFEGNELYLHREDYENAITGNGISVDTNSEIMKQSETLNMRYVQLEGTFRAGELGELVDGIGTITKISRAEVWQPMPHSK
jgi:hypothetical protein